MAEIVLTLRQLEVARLIAAGQTNYEAATALGISARTVKAHSDALRLKLGVRYRRHIPAAVRALGYDLDAA